MNSRAGLSQNSITVFEKNRQIEKKEEKKSAKILKNKENRCPTIFRV